MLYVRHEDAGGIKTMNDSIIIASNSAFIFFSLIIIAFIVAFIIWHLFENLYFYLKEKQEKSEEFKK